ncbi:MAG: 2-amino-4-hydroxy-6-hydroxymethyldihydropteridine diphosphokinase [Rhodothermaceae bacterium]|nr:2-amino-4-hydroxy-6-hydroxymethyldihydropteridine diphosphokinase [Rhodothermaceae bacterium]
MQTAYIGLGSNLGDRLAHLRQAVARLQRIAALVRCSPVYEGSAHTLVPNELPPDFLNAVVEIRTHLSGMDLLEACQKIEREGARLRRVPYAPRTIDLDILTFGGLTCSTDQLILPHPRLKERRFVLQPWYDLAPETYIPSPVDSTVSAVLANCRDKADLVRTPWLLMKKENEISL